jgi:hypothetical protein
VWFVVVVRYVCVGLCVWCGCIVAGSYPVFFFNEMKRSSPVFSREKSKALFGRDYLKIRREVILYFSFSIKLLESANQGRESLLRIRRRYFFQLPTP